MCMLEAEEVAAAALDVVVLIDMSIMAVETNQDQTREEQQEIKLRKYLYRWLYRSRGKVQARQVSGNKYFWASELALSRNEQVYCQGAQIVSWADLRSYKGTFPQSFYILLFHILGKAALAFLQVWVKLKDTSNMGRSWVSFLCATLHEESWATLCICVCVLCLWCLFHWYTPRILFPKFPIPIRHRTRLNT